MRSGACGIHRRPVASLSPVYLQDRKIVSGIGISYS